MPRGPEPGWVPFGTCGFRCHGSTTRFSYTYRLAQTSRRKGEPPKEKGSTFPTLLRWGPSLERLPNIVQQGAACGSQACAKGSHSGWL